MRHLIGLVLAMAMSAATFFAGGWGIWKIMALVRAGHGLGALHALTGVHDLLPLVAVLGAGVLLGILLAVPRISPLATGLPGLVLLGWSGLLIFRGGQALKYVPLSTSHYAAGFEFMLVNGVLGLIGAGMIVPLFVPSRWRRSDDEQDVLSDDDIDVPTALGLAR